MAGVNKKICIWADKSWAPIEAVSDGEYDWKSDDFIIVRVADKLTYDEIDTYVSNFIDRMTVS